MLSKLERINVQKAPGPDGIPNWFLRDYAAFTHEPICAIFNTSIREGRVHEVWKMTNVLSVAKVYPPVSVDNDLRPISMTPTISKLLQAIVGGWSLDTVADKLDTRQFGCLKGRSTTRALTDMLHHWHAAVDSGSSLWTLLKHSTTLTTISSSTNLEGYNCQTSSLIGSALSSATGISG